MSQATWLKVLLAIMICATPTLQAIAQSPEPYAIYCKWQADDDEVKELDLKTCNDIVGFVVTKDFIKQYPAKEYILTAFVHIDKDGISNTAFLSSLVTGERVGKEKGETFNFFNLDQLDKKGYAKKEQLPEVIRLMWMAAVTDHIKRLTK